MFHKLNGVVLKYFLGVYITIKTNCIKTNVSIFILHQKVVLMLESVLTNSNYFSPSFVSFPR